MRGQDYAMTTAEGLTHHDAELSELRLHYVTAGAGDDTIVLLHGFPQTWYEWRPIMPLLAGRYRVVAPDLRGLGDSGRPAGGYDKRTVSSDIAELMHDHLDCTQFFLVGHDWGGPVAFQLAVQQPDAVRRLAILDVMIPGDGSDLFASSGGRWHHGFHRTPDLPETLIAGRERAYLSYFFRHFGARPDAVPAEAVAEYVRCYSAPGAMAAGLAYYRATPQDIADNEAAIARGKLQLPVLALGGAKGMGRGKLCMESVARVAEDVRGGTVDSAGHWIPEETPDELAAQLLSFFGERA